MSDPDAGKKDFAERFAVGKPVQILAGPFEGFPAVIKSIDAERECARVYIMVFVGLSSDPCPEISFDNLEPAPEQD